MIIEDIDKLRQPSQEIKDFSFAKELSFRLFEELDKSDVGVGLAAPQIGEFYRAFAMKSPTGNRIFYNPVIMEYEQPFINKDEGCLSFKGKWIDTIRYKKIRLKHQINETTHFIERFQSFGSIIIQHETEHLNGILFFDKEAPKKYDKCFCGSGEKFKFCCFNKLK